MKSFENKVIWITGASSGIGREMALQCSRMGAKLVLSARNTEALEDVRNKLSDPGKSMVLPLDMEQSLVFSEKVKQVMEHFGRIDLLFNNAGISQRSLARDTPLDIDRKIMEVNFFGTVALSKAVLPVMRRQKSGHFAVVSSITGKTGFLERSAYAASKHALHGFFESLKMEEEKNNIRTSLLCPGPVQTDISKNAIDSSGKAHGKTDEMQRKGLPVEKCVQKMIAAIRSEKHELIISKGPEALGMKIKAIAPKLYFNLAKRRKKQN